MSKSYLLITAIREAMESDGDPPSDAQILKAGSKYGTVADDLFITLTGYSLAGLKEQVGLNDKSNSNT